jgi:cbb3-type cytochrome oxidase subunit 3
MRTLSKWLTIAMGIYLAIAVVMNAVEPARREKAEQDAKAAAKLEQRQAAAAASKEKRVQECAEFSVERQTIYDTSPHGQCLLHGAQYVRDKQRIIRRFGADVDRSELKSKCDLARLMAPNFRFVECRDMQ